MGPAPNPKGSTEPRHSHLKGALPQWSYFRHRYGAGSVVLSQPDRYISTLHYIKSLGAVYSNALVISLRAFVPPHIVEDNERKQAIGYRPSYVITYAQEGPTEMAWYSLMLSNTCTDSKGG